MVLMDEFMVSGETIVRDLQMGLARTRELGGTADVGYLPDMFGHVAQMPQLLRLAGIEPRGGVAGRAGGGRPHRRSGGSRPTAHACVPSTSTAPTRTAATSPPIRTPLVARARGYDAELGDAALPGGPAAAHERVRPPAAATPSRRARRRRQRRRRTSSRFTVRSLAEHVCAQPTDGPRHRGTASCARAHGPTC